MKRFLVVFLAILPLLAQDPPAPLTGADALYQMGVARLSLGKYPEAEDAFRRLMELEPANPRGLLALAQVYVAQKRGDDALRLLQSEAQKAPGRLDLHFAIGNVALQSAKYDLAIAEFQGILDVTDKTSKNAADLYFRMSEAYRLKGDPDFAIALLRQSLSLLPASPVILNNLAFLLESTGQRKAAEDNYRKILELDPKNGLALNNLAFLLADSGDAASALAYAHRARQLLPGEPTVADTMGWVYLKLNQAEDALPLFREAVQKDPRRATYRYHLAAALELRGDHAEARKESEAALKSNPSKDDEEKIKDLLQKLPR